MNAPAAASAATPVPGGTPVPPGPAALAPPAPATGFLFGEGGVGSGSPSGAAAATHISAPVPVAPAAFAPELNALKHELQLAVARGNELSSQLESVKGECDVRVDSALMRVKQLEQENAVMKKEVRYPYIHMSNQVR
jgi:hypothetical protein